MRRLRHYSVSCHVDAEPSVVWDVISDHQGMLLWTPFRKAILETYGDPRPNGVGAIRALYLIGPPTREQIIDFEPPHRLRYRLLSGLPFSDYVGEITMVPEGAGTRLSTDLRFRARVPGTAAIRSDRHSAGDERRRAPGGASNQAARVMRLDTEIRFSPPLGFVAWRC